MVFCYSPRNGDEHYSLDKVGQEDGHSTVASEQDFCEELAEELRYQEHKDWCVLGEAD